MSGDEVKPSIRSGKLSLKKRRREKRGTTTVPCTKSDDNTNTKRAKRPPIPSFSPLDDDCSFFFGNGKEEMLDKAFKSEETVLPFNNAVTIENGVKNATSTVCTSKPVYQSEQPLRELNKLNQMDSNICLNNISVAACLDLNEVASKKVQDQLPEEITNTSLACVADISKDSVDERLSRDSGIAHPSLKRQTQQQTKQIVEKDTPLASIKLDTGTLESSPNESKLLKIIGAEANDRKRIEVTSDNATPLIPIKSDTLEKMQNECKPATNELKIMSEVNVISTPTKTEASLPTPAGKWKQQILLQLSESRRSTNAVNDTSPNFHSASPSLRDFNVPRAKLLADKEITLDKKHSNILQQSKLGQIQRKQHTKRSKASNTLQNSRSSGVKQCTLCATCSCSRGSALQSLEDSAISEHQNPLQSLARSDAEIERALIGRLARLEKSSSWFDSLCTKVNRDLKRHRNKIKAKMQEADVSDRPKFLRDVDLDDEVKFCAPALPKSFVERAKHKTFSFRKKAQPTLTQMLGDSECEEVEAPSDSINDIKEENNAASKGEQTESEGSVYHDVDDDIVDYTGACTKGQSRNLWGVSRMSEEQLQESKIMQDLDPTESREGVLEEQINSDDGDGLSELLNAFEAINDEEDNGYLEGNSRHLCDSASSGNEERTSTATFSQLSPVAKSTYTSMKVKVEADPTKIEILNVHCPGWEENMRFALRQSPDELREALAYVKIKRERVMKAMRMLEKQSTVLEVFQSTLEESLERHDVSSKLSTILEE